MSLLLLFATPAPAPVRSSLFGAGTAGVVRRTMAASFNAAATVYTAAGDGTFTVVAQANVPCRLARLGLGQNGVTAADRAELAAWRHLYWDTSYAMPEDTVQLEINDERWNPVAGTYEAMDLTGDEVVYRRCQAVRAVNG